MKFRKRPVVIEALQYHGTVDAELQELLRGTPWIETMDGLVISTLEGHMLAAHGDWIIRGVKGEMYPCKPDIFEATYEVAQETMEAN